LGADVVEQIAVVGEGHVYRRASPQLGPHLAVSGISCTYGQCVYPLPPHGRTITAGADAMDEDQRR